MASGLLNGNVHALGDFWQCLQIYENLEGPSDQGGGVVRGKHCQVDAYVEVTDPTTIDPKLKEVLDLMLSHRAIQSNFHDVSYC